MKGKVQLHKLIICLKQTGNLQRAAKELYGFKGKLSILQGFFYISTQTQIEYFLKI